jgi:HSP20 family protein
MGLAGGGSHGHPQVTGSMSWVTKDADKVSPLQEDRGGGTLPLKPVECGKFNEMQKWHGNCYALCIKHAEVFNSNENSERTHEGSHTMADWHPWQTLDMLRREIDRVFNETGSRSEPFFRTAFLPGQAARRYPLINLYEDQDTVYVEALAPGVDPDTMQLSVVGNTLSIAGEKHRVAGDVHPEAFHRSERATGKFVRQIELPVEVDEEKVQAEYTNGLLTVTLPKAAKAKPKQIAVQVG